VDSETAVRQFYQALSTGDSSLLDEILADTPKEELHGVISAASDEQLE